MMENSGLCFRDIRNVLLISVDTLRFDAVGFEPDSYSRKQWVRLGAGLAGNLALSRLDSYEDPDNQVLAREAEPLIARLKTMGYME